MDPATKQLQGWFFVILIFALGIFLLFTNSAQLETYPELESISSGDLGFETYADFFETLAQEKGGAYAFQALLRADVAPGTDLHLLGHVVGDVLYTQEGIDGIHVCTPDFRNACSHSIVVGLFNDRGPQALNAISEACRDAPGGSGAYTMCFHGLGHGVLAYGNYDFEQAVDFCSQTGTPERNNREYVECVGGAVMEMIAGVHDRNSWKLQKANYFDEENPLSLCSSDFVPHEVKPICYTYLTPHLFEYVGADLARPLPKQYEEAFRYCDLIPRDDRESRAACYGGFGKEFIVLVKERDIRNVDTFSKEELKTIHRWCELADNPEGVSACKGHALASLFWGGENKSQVSVDFCSVDEYDSERCYAQLANHIQYYFPQGLERGSRCQLLPEPYQTRCVRG